MAFAATSAPAADPGFQKWLAGLWPQAQALGVSRSTFDAATRGVEPDLSLPDLDLPGREGTPPRGQAEFVQTPADYIKEANIARMAGQARSSLPSTRARWPRSSSSPACRATCCWRSGAARPTSAPTSCPRTRVTVLATQGYYGRRKDMFRNEFLLALKMLEEGHVKLADMRSSWGGAMGMTQFLPSEFYKYAVDFDGDGKKDIWNSVPDALASAAQQLAGKGWQRGVHWAYEVRVPRASTAPSASPRSRGRSANGSSRAMCPPMAASPSAAELNEPASLLLPEGTYGPAFLTLKNYYVIKEYNFSDLYVLFVGHLSDRIRDPRAVRDAVEQEHAAAHRQVETMQRTLTKLGLYKDKIDGKAGMLTRSALGAYQKANRLKVDCWPTSAVLDDMQKRAAGN